MLVVAVRQVTSGKELYVDYGYRQLPSAELPPVPRWYSPTAPHFKASLAEELLSRNRQMSTDEES